MSGLCPLPHGLGAGNEPLQREAERDGLCEWHWRMGARVVPTNPEITPTAAEANAGTVYPEETHK